MRLLSPLTEAEFVAAFLRSEIASPRFGPKIAAIVARDGIPERLLTDPDTSNEDANRIRIRVLSEYRGYRTNASLFKGFPDDVRWHRARLTPPELRHVLYIDYEYWVGFSGGSRRVIDGVERIRSNYLLRQELLPDAVDVIIGFSERIHEWDMF